MKSLANIATPKPQTIAIRKAIEAACKRIAPTWSLDQFIAVNPYWGFIDDPIRAVASRIESYSGSRMVMPRSFYREQWHSGAFGREHLQAALDRLEMNTPVEELLESLERVPHAPPRVPLMTSMADAKRDLLHGMSISDFVTHNVSQHCASYFDRYQSSWETQHKGNLYQSWLHHARNDMSPWLLMGIHHVRPYARSLPNEPLAMIERACSDLPVPQEEWEHYLAALLMSINGWASWCAFERWQARLSHQDDDHIVQLLAIRLAWDHFVYVRLLDSRKPQAWQDPWKDLVAWREQAESQSSFDWIFQEALELAYQSSLCQALMRVPTSQHPIAHPTPAVQAIFCIDVRSEVFRRALEESSETVQTLGFAGFFGLPISYKPLGTSAERPQLPGLLAPKLHVSETTGSETEDQDTLQARQRGLFLKSIWKDFRSSANSTFTFVESCGFFYAASLLRNTLHKPVATTATRDAGLGQYASLRPCLVQGNASCENLCDLIAGILANMSLTTNFARLVLLTGHGSQSMNNPHAAGLDCGACGGQTGEVNATVLADLLNDTTVRNGLHSHGIAIPTTTHVLAALHNTTTDEVTIFDTDRLPQSHISDLTSLRNWLQQAGHRARKERAESVGIKSHGDLHPKGLLRRFQVRSCDWSQVRPEWGLANNAAFLIAPRNRSRGINLHGRVFLHDYESVLDPEGTVLEAIMTAPMLVTNWINMQYYASTVDNRLYGSGNKVLHNVVGGRLGVFEGNGGDLRIGLPLQSLHDGDALRHMPLRLSVFIEAPKIAIALAVHKHEVLRNLVDNSWLHLFQIEPKTNSISRFERGGWDTAAKSRAETDKGFEVTAGEADA